MKKNVTGIVQTSAEAFGLFGQRFLPAGFKRQGIFFCGEKIFSHA